MILKAILHHPAMTKGLATPLGLMVTWQANPE
jgi:hypothetical protein